MAKLMIFTQVYENYAWDENGVLHTGPDAYWKPKSGNEYVVREFDLNNPQATVDQVRAKIETRSAAFEESVINWSVESDDYLTAFEKSQMEYEGSITYPAVEIAA
jgi:hypothetical protein